MNFTAPYDRTTALEFLRNFLPNDFSASSGERVEVGFEPNLIQSVSLLGTVPSLNDLKVYEVQHSSEHDPRVTLSRESFRLLAKHSVRKALIFFVTESSQNYRFSLVTVELDWKKSGRIKHEYSNPRRQSFLLGPKAKVRTPQSFLETRGRVRDAKDLADRFSVEVVNKEFYKQIATLFVKLTGGKLKLGNRTEEFATLLELPSTNKPNPETLDSFLPFQEFAVRLIGRCIFCWFLKQKKTVNDKPLIPESLLSVGAVNNTEGYYHQKLEKLFFEVLNKPKEQRPADVPDGSDDVPFLNGGLFDPHHEDFYTDGKWNGALKVPDAWLHEFFDLLETYNFTIDENTPVDTELSVDPEMLGRIFENLLAEINPETGESARKHTGSYYTPREVVEYMVDESLKLYLSEKTGIDDERLSSLLSYGEEDGELKDSEKQEVITALEQLKIIDPACGSGAFPLGILHKMVLVLQKVDPEAEQWLQSLLTSIPDQTARTMMQKKLEDDTDLWDYTRKLGVIRRSIYGVDIQPIGVEITKLRCFLSLVVDEKINDRKKNRGIESLPNLEFKFVCANSLITLPTKKETPQASLGFEEADDDIEQLRQLRDKYFSSHGKDKAAIIAEFKKMQGQLTEYWISHQKGQSSLTSKLANWSPFENKPSEWFDPEWMFGIKDGFDIVIANPPYVRQEHIAYKAAIKDVYEVGSGTADLYCYFYELGWRLLKEHGILTYITSNKYLRAAYGKKLKGLLKNKMTIRSLIDFGDSPVFEVTAYPSILVAQKGHTEGNQFKGCTIETEEELNNFIQTLQQKNIVQEQDELPDDDVWSLLQKEEHNLMMAIEGDLQDTKRLAEFVGSDFFAGIKTGYNPAFIISQQQRDILVSKDSKSAEIIKPFLRGKDIKRWVITNPNLYVIFARQGIDIDQYKAVKAHLAKYRKQLEPRPRDWDDSRKWDGRKSGTYKWYELQDSIAFFEHFEDKKIVYPDISEHCNFALDIDNFYPDMTAFVIPSNDLYLLGVLNSSTTYFYLSRKTSQVRGNFLRFKKQYVKKMPIRIPSDKQRSDIEKLVKQVLKNKEAGKDTAVLEDEINQLVYEVYGLNKKERGLIESLTA